MAAERRAQLRVPNVPRSRISERAPFRIYEHAQCRVFERTSLQRAHSIGRGCRVHTCAMAIGADFKMYPSVSFVRIESNSLQYTGDTVAKNDGPEF